MKTTVYFQELRRGRTTSDQCDSHDCKRNFETPEYSLLNLVFGDGKPVSRDFKAFASSSGVENNIPFSPSFTSSFILCSPRMSFVVSIQIYMHIYKPFIIQ